SEKSAGRGQISSDLQRQYLDIDQKADGICTVQVILQPTTPKSDRLLDSILHAQSRRWSGKDKNTRM
ncbi:MAG: hypothetical protein Q7T62_01180, partial [Undibacterium sp.]|nr:hypothetical protein [Undibacterium sp.]